MVLIGNRGLPYSVVLQRAGIACLLALSALIALLTATPLLASGPLISGPGEVTLPLDQYLEWVEAAEARAQEDKGLEEPATITWVDHQTTLRLAEPGKASKTVDVEMALTARVIGRPDDGLPLAYEGFLSELEVKADPSSTRVRDSAVRDSRVRDSKAPPSETSPGAVWSTRSGNAIQLLATAPGAYNIKVAGQLLLAQTQTGYRFSFPQPMASVSKLEIEMPVDREWDVSDGPVLVGDRELDGKRVLTFALARGTSAWMEILESSVTAGADRLLASSVVATVIQLQREHWQRHDVAMFDVSRGSLDTMRLSLPEHLVVDQAVTDEGPIPWLDPSLKDLELSRRRPLKSGDGAGYVSLVSPLSSAAEAGGSRSVTTVDLRPVVPELRVRAHYLAITGSAPAEVQPAPADHWARVDADDLPSALGQALGAVDLVAVWRRVEGKDAGSLSILPLPDAPRIASWVSERSTTTLLTVDGTLLHRDLLEVSPVGSVLEVELPEHAVLWSVKVGSESIRPLERDGKMLIPMSLAPVDGASVEIVTVLERVVPKGRSVLDLELPSLGLPVVEHVWRILLPKGDRYRYRGGSLSLTKDQISSSMWEGLGEDGSTSLIGRLTESSQEGLPGVTVTLEAAQVGRQQAITNVSGQYRFDDLSPGRATVTAYLEGFNTTVGTARLRRGRVVRLDMVMPFANVVEEILVMSEAPMMSERGLKDLKKEAEKTAEAQIFADYQSNVAGLQQGLVGGVRPLPVTIPEEGKSLTLVGVMPPSKVTAGLDVKAGR